MARPGYRAAIEWLAWNDDTHWLDDPYGTLSVATALVCDMFGYTEERVTKDLRLACKRRDAKLDTKP